MTRTTRPKNRRSAWRLAAGLTGVALAVPLLASTTAAQAHDVTMKSYEYRKTSKCPCSISDEWDGTYFKRDKGAEAAKVRLYEGSDGHRRLVGKVEFHPYGERLWLYDTAKNSDAFYYKVSWPGHSRPYAGPDGGKHRVIKLPNIDEGDRVTIRIYDSAGPGNLITTLKGVA